MSGKSPKKEDVDKLKDEDLFGDFKSMDEFIESDSFEVIDKNAKKLGKFEITASDQKKRPGHAAPPKEKQDVSQLQSDDLFGDFKPMEEFIDSESFEVTMSKEQKQRRSKRLEEIDPTRLEEDDLFGDFKPMEEFIASDSFEVTVSSPNANPSGSSPQQPPPNQQTKNNSALPLSPTTSPSGPTPPASFPTPPQTFSGQSPSMDGSPSFTPPGPTTPTVSPIVSPPTISASVPPQPTGPSEATKSKLAAIAAKRKKAKSMTKKDPDDLFDDLDPLELDE